MKKLSIKSALIISFLLLNLSFVFGQRPVVFKKNINSNIIYSDDVITFLGNSSNSTYVWSSNIEYDFSVNSAYIVSFDTYLEKQNEVGVLFSKNKKSWDSGQSDAISVVSISRENKDGWSAIRTGMYKSFVKANYNTVETRVWHHVEVVFQAYHISMYIDKELVIESNIKYSDRPNSGYIGITQFGEKKGVIKYKNFQIR